MSSKGKGAPSCTICKVWVSGENKVKAYAEETQQDQRHTLLQLLSKSRSPRQPPCQAKAVRWVLHATVKHVRRCVSGRDQEELSYVEGILGQLQDASMLLHTSMMAVSRGYCGSQPFVVSRCKERFRKACSVERNTDNSQFIG